MFCNSNFTSTQSNALNMVITRPSDDRYRIQSKPLEINFWHWVQFSLTCLFDSLFTVFQVDKDHFHNQMDETEFQAHNLEQDEGKFLKVIIEI